MSDLRWQGCTIPPQGWWCSRAKGHEGPCAARPEEAPASVDTHPKDGDAVAAPLVSGAVPKAGAHD